MATKKLVNLSRATRRRVIVVVTTLLSLVAVDRVVVILDPTLARYDTRWNHNAFYRKPAALQAGPMPDIVLMGSSRAALGLVPEIFEAATGLQTYNMAVAGSQTAEWQVLARGLFSERHPHLVVLGVNAGEFWADYEPLNGATFLFDFGDLVEACRREGRCRVLIGPYVARRVGDFWATFHRRHELKMCGYERLAGMLPDHARRSRAHRLRISEPTPRDGYRHPKVMGRSAGNLQDAIDSGRLGPRDREQCGRFDADATPFARFDELIGFLQGAGVDVLVAYLPNSPATEVRWRSVEPLISEHLRRMCRDRDVRFVDCREAPFTRSNREFVDEVHVGPRLARRISEYIVNTLTSSGLPRNGHDRIAGNIRKDLEAP